MGSCFSGQVNKYQQAAGSYNLSGFEMASRLYLLEDRNFLFFASFGNVDLEVYGSYTISETDIIELSPNKELLDHFFVYGGKSNESDKVVFNYKKPYDEEAEKVTVIIDGAAYDLSEFNEEDVARITVEMPKNRTFKIEYSNRKYGNVSESFAIPEDMNDVRIYHNYYADMTKEFCQSQLEISKDVLISNGQSIEKTEAQNPKMLEEATQYLKYRKRKISTITFDNQVYQKLNSL